MKRKRITKVLPDKIFCELWNSAQKIDTEEEYIIEHLSYKSDGKIDFEKYDIDDIMARTMLINIYKAARYSFDEIFEKSGLKKSEFSYRFCIPIRTIEDWCNGKGKCNSYMRLMFIREFKLLTLGQHIILKSQDKVKAVQEEQTEVRLVKEENDKVVEDTYLYSLADYEQTHIHRSEGYTREWNDKSSYLDEILSKRKAR